MAITLESLKTLTNKVELTINGEKFTVKFNVDKFYKISTTYHKDKVEEPVDTLEDTTKADMTFLAHIKDTLIATVVEWSLVDVESKALPVKESVEEIPDIILFALYAKMVDGCSIDFLK